MAEITRKRQGELVRGALEILAQHPDGLHVTEVLTNLEVAVPPTPFEGRRPCAVARRPTRRRRAVSPNRSG